MHVQQHFMTADMHNRSTATVEQAPETNCVHIIIYMDRLGIAGIH